MSNLVIQKWQDFKYKAKFEKKLFSSKVDIFNIFFKKKLCEERFEDLEFNSNWKFKIRGTMPHKITAL